MRKIVLALVLFAAFSVNGQAQSWKNLLGKVANKVTEEVVNTDTQNVVTNILGTLIGNSVPFSKALIEGAWNYQGTACVLESENALSEIGGTVATAKIEEKLDGYFNKIGISKGTCTLTFLPNDSCYFAVNGRKVGGTYKLNEEEKIIDFSFLHNKLNMKSYLSYNVTDIDVVFDVDKLLDLIKNATSTVSSKTSTVGSLMSSSSSSKLSTAGATLETISTLLEGYDGMMLGMKLSK